MTEERPHVLVVDDEEALRRAVKRTLEAAGFAAAEAATGEEALESLAARRYEVVVADIKMPRMNGIELLRAVRERDTDAAVILVTGNPTVDSAAQAVEYGALRYLVKPVDRAELVAAVNHAVKLQRVARLKREAVEQLGDPEKLLGDRATLEGSLARGLDTLFMVYQPIVDPRERKVVAYEALVRTREPTLPHPGVLFAVAERRGRVWDVGRAIRRSVATTLANLPPDGDVYVNLHGQDLFDETLFSEDAPLAPFARRLVLEITERVALDGGRDIPSRIARLRDIGYRVAIDDLGAGYAGLSYFALLSPDVVKLDMSLVRDVDQNPLKQKLVGSMTALCRELGMRVVAEGIETPAERDTIVRLGGDLQQGYLFARPGAPFPAVTW